MYLFRNYIGGNSSEFIKTQNYVNDLAHHIVYSHYYWGA